MGNIKIFFLLLVPFIAASQDYPRFELYQLVQGQDSGQFVTTGVDSNLDFNSVLRFRFQDSTLLIGADTVITDAKLVPILLATIDAGLGIEVNQVNGQIFIESLSIEDSIYNGSGSIIAKGTPLYAADTQGNYWDVAPARADDPSKMPVVVIAGEEIGIGEVGLGLIKGHIKQVNTTGLADGSEVYVGATGGYTSTKPTDEGVIIQRLGTVIKGETTNGSGIINLGDEGFWNDYTSLTKLRDTLVLVRGSITTEIGDSLTNYASRTELADTASAIRSDIPAGAITATNQGNNRIPTFDGVNNIIDGLNNYWINEFGEMVDNLSDGTAPNPVGYKFKIDSRLFADSIESNVIETASGGKANLNSLTTTGTTIFSGTIGGNNTTVLPSGQIGINETPSGNLSLTTYWGALFNNDQYNGVNGDFTVRSANQSSMFFIDSDLDAIGIGGATPNSDFDVNINGGVQINSSAAGGIYDGLIVQGDTDPVLFYVNADRDKVGISEALPNWTLDVDGDINFNGDLYQNDALVTFGSTTINDNAINRVIIGTDTSNTLDALSNVLIDNFPQIGFKNATTGSNYSTDGTLMYLGNTSVDFLINNVESTGTITLLTNNNSRLQALSNGDIKIYNLGTGTVYSDSGILTNVNPSDKKLKKNIKSINIGLQEILQLNPISFNYKTDNKSDKPRYGFIAQEVNEIVPEIVDKTSNDYLGIKSDNIIPILTKAIQEQQIIIESQDKRIRQLEEMVKQLIEKK